jgi:hypothetical protein
MASRIRRQAINERSFIREASEGMRSAPQQTFVGSEARSFEIYLEKRGEAKPEKADFVSSTGLMSHAVEIACKAASIPLLARSYDHFSELQRKEMGVAFAPQPPPCGEKYRCSSGVAPRTQEKLEQVY